MKGQAGISAIYRLGYDRQDEPGLVKEARLWGLRRKLWREAGVITCRPGDLPPEVARRLVEWAEQQYGGRNG